MKGHFVRANRAAQAPCKPDADPPLSGKQPIFSDRNQGAFALEATALLRGIFGAGVSEPVLHPSKESMLKAQNMRDWHRLGEYWQRKIRKRLANQKAIYDAGRLGELYYQRAIAVCLWDAKSWQRKAESKKQEARARSQ